MINMTNRTRYLLLALMYVGMLGVGLFLQFVIELEPCPLCILQRMTIMSTGLIALIAFMHNPPSKKANGIYIGLLEVGSLTSLGIALRHIWIQHLPADEAASCGPGLETTLDNIIAYLPQGSVTEALFRSSAECSEVSWRLLGLSLPELTLPFFVALAVYYAWLFFNQLNN
jgi:disulfide bond formation protein DsbB